MTAATTAHPRHPVLPTGRLRLTADPKLFGPAAFALANALAFYIIRPGVNDLWAARARASAVSHGVGLSYWFSWFGGGTTPGNYSVLTPYLCAVIGTELTGALAAIVVAGLVTVLVQGTPHATAAAYVGAVAATLNLWSGRVPFLLGAAAGVAALIAVRGRYRTGTVALTLLSTLFSPVAGAFLVLGLSGTFLTTRTKEYRPIIAYAVTTAALSLGVAAIAFGTPPPEPFSALLLLELVAGLGVFWLAAPPAHLRTTLYVSVLAMAVIWAVPNGLGSNYGRFVWFCLPVAIAATSGRSTRLAVFAVVPMVIAAGVTTVTDLRNATKPVSSVSYYTSLAHRLDQIPDLQNYRVEVVNHGAHAGYDALLEHAMLARGWETQEDAALNKVLNQDPLDPTVYKVWLDNNAVGYVALPADSVGGFPEYTLVQQGKAPYLHGVWSNANWELFRVASPTRIVGRPGRVITHDQKSLTIQVPCACHVPVRVRWKKFLTAALQRPDPKGPGLLDTKPLVRGMLVDDGSGWTILTAPEAGTYVLRGSLRGLLR